MKLIHYNDLIKDFSKFVYVQLKKPVNKSSFKENATPSEYIQRIYLETNLAKFCAVHLCNAYKPKQICTKINNL